MVHITLGQAIWASVKPIIKIYLIIGVGFLMGKMGILPVEATRIISDVVLTVLLPCLSFNKIVANIEDKDIKSVGIICLSAVLIFATGLFFAFIVRVLLPVPKQWYGGILAGGMFPNISDLPIAYLQSMDQGLIFTEDEGNKGVANVIIFLTMFLICIFNLGGFRLIESDFEYNDDENAVRALEATAIRPSMSKNTTSTDTNKSSFSNEQKVFNDKYMTGSSFTEVTGPNANANALSITRQSTKSIGPLSLSGSNFGPKITKPVQAKSRDTTGCIPVEESQTTPDLDSMENQSFASTVHSYNTSDSYNSSLDTMRARRTASEPRAYNTTTALEEKSLDDRYVRNMPLAALEPIRSIDMRALPPQDIHHLIREYSNVDQYGHQRRNSSLIGTDMDDTHSIKSNSTLQTIKTANLTRILTSDATVSKKDIETSGESLPRWMKKFPLTSLAIFFLKNCLRPCSMAVIIALIVAFIPWVKALFVTTANTPHIKQAPDNAPPLSFFMDFTSYVGAASVPFGLILLGATLGRLKIGNLYPGFWKAAVALVILRQCVMPIFGVLWCDRLVKAGWVNWQDDSMLLFVIAISWNLPTMTTLIYFTASFTPPEVTNPIQMECVSFFLMLQYPLMVVSLPFLVSYFLKVQMNL
ncbi:YNL095C [Saccharomyces arboricola H-6]|uniref:YNL095C n=1 Tax=Saccharomyces arboricola (strain H-6 / AS 2.3317 / CBS 10644) TaxID=1160507 RepID=J8PZX4_SACAR|nr:YNL095C [Saccharomyces arboricola H-6]